MNVPLYRRLSFIALVLVTATAACARRASAATANVSPAADTFVSSANAANNYGMAGALSLSASGLPKGEFQTLMRFNFAAAKTSFDATFGTGQWVVQSVALQLFTANPNNVLFNTNAAGPFEIGWMQNDTWVEGTGMPMMPTTDGVTFDALPSFLSPADQPLGTFTFPGGTSGSNSYALATSAGLLGDITAGGVGSLRLFTPAGATTGYVFNSVNFPTSSTRPLLTVNAIAVPEPGVAAVLLVVAASLAARRPTRGR